jgi:hypothetical protein
MILFQKDWMYYPNAIIDIKTKNTSFIRIVSLFKRMGIKNHAFPLLLIDSTLQGVDPFDPYLTLEQKLAINLECKLNPFYYFREVAIAPSKSGNEVVQFQANRGNIASIWLFFNHITFLLIQIRQTGKSFIVDSLTILLMNVMCTNTQINLLTKDDSLRASNIRRLKDIESELPTYLRRRSKGDSNNLEGMTVTALGNTFLAHVPQKSPKAALNTGRGLTSPVFIVDEGPFQPNIAISLPAALAAGTAARDMARKNNEPYGTILTTTAGKRDDRDGKFMYNLMSTSAQWTERFYDCNDANDLEQMIRKHSKNGELRVNVTLNHKQLGKDDLWLKQAIEDAIVSGEDADRDFFNLWTSGSQTSPLPLSLLEKMRQSVKAEEYVSIDPPYGYITRWFLPEESIPNFMRNRPCVMGMDTSDASGGDDISLFLIDIASAETIAAGTYNETNLITLSEWICSWLVRYENITLIIERKSSGVAILDYLLLMLPVKGIDPFKRLFNTAVNDHLENPERWSEISVPLGRRRSDVYIKYKKCFGFTTAGSGMASRSELYSTTLQLAAKKGSDKVRDITTVNQITGLTTVNGRIDHAPGEHDDMVIAWLLCYWLITQGKNIGFYGIQSRNIFSELITLEDISPNKLMIKYEQQAIRQDIENLYEKMSNERDEYVSQIYENKLRALNRKLILEEGERFSVDDLINSLRNEKRINTR